MAAGRGALRRSLQRLGSRGLPPLTQHSGTLPADADTVLRHLQKWPPVVISKLSNGFQVASCNQGGETATVGIWIDAGSRFETPETNGVAHFLEHLTFKGTTNRSKTQIEDFFEFVGGHLNAYTTREQTTYYVKVFKEYLPEAFDVLTDILRRPLLNRGDIERERSTIMQEMEEVEANIDEVLMDHVHLTGFPGGQGLGLTILGPAENIERTIDRDMIREYITQHYTAPRMSVIACGAVDHAQLEKLAQEMWGDLPVDPPKPELHATFTAGECCYENNIIPSPHLAVAWPICPQHHQDMLACQVLQNVIGTWDRTSHDLTTYPVIHNFFEKSCTGPQAKGVLESVQAFTTPYSDIGLFGVYCVATPTEAEPGPDAFASFATSTFQTLVRVAAVADENALKRAKETLKTSLLLNLDGSTALADELGKQMLAYNRWLPFEELFARIDAIDRSDMVAAFEKYIHRKDFVLCGVGPTGVMPARADVAAALWAA
eukprot:TRINITY_DN22162_c0_g1_i1.p1 TRINITY_DN22162_c0_g1~~TRINITY_DN22162_c0_g1_i1.p1  ORF type:complete len:515 (+),score=174.62 TRINITY_DN22162_c0_g1_i1:80-1546(+)